MRKIIISLFILLATIGLVGCENNQYIAKRFGGKYTIDLPAGEKLVNITWKEDDIWYLTRPMREGEKAETYKFKADTLFDVLEGTVIIREHELKNTN